VPGKHVTMMPDLARDPDGGVAMPEWAKELGFSDGVAPLHVLAARLTAAFVFGCIVAGVYWLTAERRSRSERTPLATLPLLAVVIALLTLVIGESMARAFGLFGAMAIVRFRTVVEDTRDTAFVILAVACGMSAGVGYVIGPIVCVPWVLLGAWLFRRRGPGSKLDATLVVRVGIGHSVDAVVQPYLAKLSYCRMIGMATSRGGSALDYTYEVRLPNGDGATTVVRELSRLDGVQNVELNER
jgi:Domain of unknown function (DUF4956)